MTKKKTCIKCKHLCINCRYYDNPQDYKDNVVSLPHCNKVLKEEENCINGNIDTIYNELDVNKNGNCEYYEEKMSYRIVPMLEKLLEELNHCTGEMATILEYHIIFLINFYNRTGAINDYIYLRDDLINHLAKYENHLAKYENNLGFYTRIDEIIIGLINKLKRVMTVGLTKEEMMVSSQPVKKEKKKGLRYYLSML